MKSKIKQIRFLTLLFVLFCSNFAMAWNAAGHHLMAALTWDLLSTQQQNYWVDILEHHPRFKKDFTDHLPKYVKRHPETYGEWIFRRAAAWPDIARNLPKRDKQKYHHGSWHYINYPIYLDKKVWNKYLNLNTRFKGKLHDDLNIIQALKGNIALLARDNTSKKDKAIALSWVLHLVADAHQPLHSTSLFSKVYFPKGDKGGNSIKISGQGRISNLHWYWDSRLDNSTSFRIIDLKAKKLTKKYHKTGILNQEKSIRQWLKTAHKLAKDKVYTAHILNSLRLEEKSNKPQATLFISNTYDIQAREISQQQIVIAGFQLAEILKILD
jgi:hypothetical protein